MRQSLLLKCSNLDSGLEASRWLLGAVHVGRQHENEALHPPKIVGDKDDKTPLELNWQRCMQGGCIAGAIVADGALAKLAARAEPGIITFKDVTDRDLAILQFFRGVTQAFAAPAKEL